MDLTKTAREITRLMLPYLTTQQNHQLKKVLSHCLFDENELAESSGDSDNKSFLDLFLSAKRLEGCSDRTIAYYEATINKLLESFDTPACDLGTEEIRSYLSDYQQKPASVVLPSTMSEESSQASTHGSRTKTISLRAQLDASKESRHRKP